MRNKTSSIQNEICKDVRVEPQLQPLTGESFTPSSATGSEMRLDVCARWFWQAGQNGIFLRKARRYAKQELLKTL